MDTSRRQEDSRSRLGDAGNPADRRHRDNLRRAGKRFLADTGAVSFGKTGTDCYGLPAGRAVPDGGGNTRLPTDGNFGRARVAVCIVPPHEQCRIAAHRTIRIRCRANGSA